MGSFCSKHMKFELKKNAEDLSFMTLNSEAKFEYALTLWFQKWHEELGELSLEHSKVVHFLSKAYKENFNEIMCHDTEG